MNADTIVACATPHGRGAVALVRLSGPSARSCVEALNPGGPRWQPRRAQLRPLRANGVRLDEALITWMPGPNSYTGEDTVELGLHGNPVIVAQVIDALVAEGARLARPGEFTRRAVENGRLDLLSAEQVATLIEARTPTAVALTQTSDLQNQVNELGPQLLGLCAEMEVRLDHPGEDLGEQDDETLARTMEDLVARCQGLAGTWSSARLHFEGAKVALVGPVNAGKSSLFNCLMGFDRALVSDRPGTTRDVVEGTVRLGSLDVTFLDTAGEGQAGDELEARGQGLGRNMAAAADLVLLVFPLNQGLSDETQGLLSQLADRNCIRVGTHLDCGDLGHPTDVRVSTLDESGLGDLKRMLMDRLGENNQAPESVVISQRQHDLLSGIAHHVDQATQALLGPLGVAVAAEELTAATERLTDLRGGDVREEVLDEVFSRFCIGK